MPSSSSTFVLNLTDMLLRFSMAKLRIFNRIDKKNLKEKAPKLMLQGFNEVLWYFYLELSVSACNFTG